MANMNLDKRKRFKKSSCSRYLSNRIASPCACISSTRLSAVARSVVWSVVQLFICIEMTLYDVFYSVGEVLCENSYYYYEMCQSRMLLFSSQPPFFRSGFRTYVHVAYASTICRYCWYTNYSFLSRNVSYTIIKFHLCQKWINIKKTISCHN